MTKLIEMTNVKKTYDGKKYVLDGVDFSIDCGQIAVIFGESGCGKSTFLNIVGLLDDLSSGSYIFNGVHVSPRKLNSYYSQRASDIGFVFQSYQLIESLSVKDNILMPFLYNNRRVDRGVFRDLDEILTDLNMISLKDTKAAFLSGGEKQRVAICRAMIKKPKLIIADEPTGNLDEKNSRLVISALNKIADSGAAVIVVTHNRHLDFGCVQRYSLEKGTLLLC